MASRRRSSRPRLLLALACLGVALAAADTYVVVLALTDMMAGVGLGIDQLQRAAPIISGFLLGYVATLPLVGRLADLVDRGRVLRACLLLFVLGSVVTALAVDLPVLVAGRVLQGVGGGGLVPATLALVADLWPPRRRGLPLGVVGGVQEMGSLLGPVLGAVVLAVADWRAIFWLGAVVGLVLAGALVLLGSPQPPDHTGDPASAHAVDRLEPGTRGRVTLRAGRVLGRVLVLLGLGCGLLALWAPRRLVQDVTLGTPFVPYGSSPSRLATPLGLAGAGLLVAGLALVLLVDRRRWWGTVRRIDLPGALLLGGALGCLVVTFAASDPAHDVVGPAGWALLPVAAACAAGYGWRHRRAVEPLVPRGTLGPGGWRTLAASWCVGAALVAVVVDVPVLARLTLGGDEVQAATVLLRFLVAVPVGALLGGLALRRAGAGRVTALGLVLAAAMLAVMGTWGSGSLQQPVAPIVLAAAGLGVGLTLAPLNAAALDAAPEHAHGTASSLVVVARMTGMVVGLGLLTAVGLHAYYAAVAALPDPTDPHALLAAGLVQVQWVLRGGAIAALAGAVLALTMPGRVPRLDG